LNLTRLHLGIAHESQFQGLGINDIEIAIPCQLTEGSKMHPTEIAAAPSQPMPRDLEWINEQIFLGRGEDPARSHRRDASSTGFPFMSGI